MDARELARSARTTAAWTACEQAADYWLALAERVELEPEQPQRIRVALSPSSSRTVYPDTMPILGYFLAVGVALFLGLVALNAYVDPGRPDGAPSHPWLRPPRRCSRPDHPPRANRIGAK